MQLNDMPIAIRDQYRKYMMAELEEHPVERLARDTKLLELFGGTTGIRTFIITRQIPHCKAMEILEFGTRAYE